MASSFILFERELALQLYRALHELDPVRWREERAQSLRQRWNELLQEIDARLSTAQREEGTSSEGSLLVLRFTELLKVIREQLPQSEVSPDEVKRRWLEFKKSVQPAYEALVLEFRNQSVRVPSLRPANTARSLMHISSALAGVAVIEWIREPRTIIAIAFLWALSAWTMEVSRRISPAVNEVLMKLFSSVAHAHERERVNSATWYATALLILSLTQVPWLCAISVAILGFADPAAGWVGRKFGKIRIAHRRTLEGSFGFLVAAFVSAGAVLRIAHPEVAAGHALWIATFSAVFGAVAEVLSTRVDDNLSVPLVSAVGGGLAGVVLGVPLF